MSPDRQGRVTEGDGSLLARWMDPATLIATGGVVFTLWGGWVVQGERLESLRAEVQSIKRDYQRSDVLAEQLRAISARLYSIEQKLGADTRP